VNKVERPLWYLWFGVSGGHHDDADKWFDENVEPVNDKLTAALELLELCEKGLQSFKDQTEKYGGDYLPGHAIYFNGCLTKIKAFRGIE
jgi:hypothetical protein